MNAGYDPLADLRTNVNQQLLDNLLGPLGDPAVGGADSSEDPASPQRADDAPFEVAMNPAEIMAVRAGMRLSGADKRLDATLGRMTGGAFSPGQIHELEARALRNADPKADVEPLQGLEEGPPVVVNPSQKAIIDRLMSQMGSDPLGRAAQTAYQGAWTHGQIKLRGR